MRTGNEYENSRLRPYSGPIGTIGVGKTSACFAASKHCREDTRVAAGVKQGHDRQRLLVWCVRDEILIVHDMEAQRSLRQVRTSMSYVG
jgi:hypothetical protein